MRNIALCVFATALLAAQARADLVDLTSTPGWGKINGAYFLASDLRATGTGILDPFVRTQARSGDAEQGYNTSGTPQYDTKSGPWTHALLVTSVPTPGDLTMPDGTALNGNYWEFILDTNQSGNGPISLNALQIYRGGSALAAWAGNAVTTSGEYDWADLSEIPGSLVYDLDATTNGQVDVGSGTGSGSGDLFAYIPTSGGGNYLLLYCQFGIPDGSYESNGGFEEWAVRVPTAAVPLPGAVVLGLLGLGVAGMRLRRSA